MGLRSGVRRGPRCGSDRRRLGCVAGEGTDLPRSTIRVEDAAKNDMNACVGLFAHVALLEYAGEEVAVWAVGRPEVLGEVDEGRGRHGATGGKRMFWWRGQERTQRREVNAKGRERKVVRGEGTGEDERSDRGGSASRWTRRRVMVCDGWVEPEADALYPIE